MDWVTELLSAPLLDGPAELGPWWSLVRRSLMGTSTLQQAALGGLAADRLGLAFAAGYQAALTRLVPDRAHGAVLGVAFTEEGGAHPKAIRSHLDAEGSAWRLSGHKGWVTCGTLATELVVVASVGAWADGRNRLRACRVGTDAEGVTVTPHGPAPFVPEVPHASVTFDGVLVEQLLPGDGYTAWLKSFRTVEDIHVHGALLGYLMRVGRQARWPDEHVEAALVPLLALEALAQADPLDPITHRGLGGVMASTRALLVQVEPLWERVDAEQRARWERDQPLLKVAGRARVARLERARVST